MLRSLLPRNRRMRIARVLGLVAMVSVIGVLPASAASTGTLKGKVVNATANGSSVAEVEVTMTAYFGETERNKSTAKTDTEGNFQFTGLDTSSNYAYEVTTTYQKADYSAPRVSFSNSDDQKEVTLKVYDATGDEKVVKATAKHYVLNVGKGGIEVNEILVLNNASDKSYIGSREVGSDQRETSRYLPPSGAQNVNYGDGLMSCCVVKDGAGFVDTMAIQPGQDQKTYTYKLPYEGTSLAFSSTLQQNVDKVQLLVPQGVRADVSGLANHGSQVVQGTSYQLFSGDNLQAGTTFEVNLQGLPQGGIPGGAAALIGISFGILAALVAVFFLLRRRSEPAPLPAYSHSNVAPPTPKRGARAAVSAAALNPTMLELEKQDLLSAMANLDDWFEAGRINRKEYERLRAEKKERLVLLMRQSAGRRSPART